MSFRFRRSVRLAPGVRLNFSKSGTSLSVGGRGATMNFSSRGTRTTLGIPGTGLSWSQTTSRRSTEAALRRAEKEARVQAARAAVESFQARQRSVIFSWQDLPSIPGRAAFEAELEPRPFIPTPPPPAIDEKAACRALIRRLRNEAWERMPWGMWRGLPLAGFLPLAFLWTERWFLGIALAAMSVGAIAAAMHLVRGARAWLEARRAFPEVWPRHLRELERAYAEAVLEHERRTEEERLAHARAEEERIAKLEKLIDGDPEVTIEAVEQSIGLLDFPFETRCEVLSREPGVVQLAIDLPEIEDTIPETTARALKDGTIREVNRTKTDQNRDYAFLVTGLALQLARATFASSPALRKVVVAAYTQRRRPRTGVLEDHWLFELELDRATVEAASSRTDPVALALKVPGRIDLRSNHHLRHIDPPAWWNPPDAPMAS